MNMPPLAIIAGPTASGKSALALALAERTGGRIVNADSAQVYRDLRILTARPSPEDEDRAPHRLYGVRDGAEPWSAADWADAARAEIASAHAAGVLPILVGGTGLYIRTLLDGIAPVPPVDPAVRKAVRARDTAGNAAELAHLDPAMAARLNANDSQRIARALEVRLSTGRSLADWQAERRGGLAGTVRIAALVLEPPRPWLHERAHARFDRMLGPEGLAEALRLHARALDPALPIMRAIGVREVIGWATGALSREAALKAGAAATRAYLKRQATWLRNQTPADWPRLPKPLDETGLARAAADLAHRAGSA